MGVYRCVHVFYEMKKGTMRGKNTLRSRKTSKGGLIQYIVYGRQTQGRLLGEGGQEAGSRVLGRGVREKGQQKQSIFKNIIKPIYYYLITLLKYN